MKFILPPSRKKLPYGPTCNYNDYLTRVKNIQIRGANFKPTYRDITRTLVVLDQRKDTLTIEYDHAPTQHTVDIELHTAYDQLITYKTYVSGGFSTVVLQANRDREGYTFAERMWKEDLEKKLTDSGKFTSEEIDKHVEEFFKKIFRKGKDTPMGSMMVNNDTNDTNVIVGRSCILNT